MTLLVTHIGSDAFIPSDKLARQILTTASAYTHRRAHDNIHIGTLTSITMTSALRQLMLELMLELMLLCLRIGIDGRILADVLGRARQAALLVISLHEHVIVAQRAVASLTAALQSQLAVADVTRRRRHGRIVAVGRRVVVVDHLLDLDRAARREHAGDLLERAVLRLGHFEEDERREADHQHHEEDERELADRFLSTQTG